MNKGILMLTVLLLMAGTSFGQSYTDILENRKVTVNYSDHTVVAHLKPVKSIPASNERSYTWFSANQIRSTQGGYSGRLLNGLYQDFYMNKNLKEAGYYSKGLKQGLWKSWTEEGVLKEELNWAQGAKNGRYFKYNEAGKLLEKGKYRRNLLNGKQEVFTGDSVKVLHYKNGRVVQPKSLIQVPRFIKRWFTKKSKS